MIRLNFLPSWIYERLSQVGVLIKLEDQKDSQVKSSTRYRDRIVHTCPRGHLVFKNWMIERITHKYATDFGPMYLVTVGQCPRCLEIFWDVFSCDPEELGWTDATVLHKRKSEY